MLAVISNVKTKKKYSQQYKRKRKRRENKKCRQWLTQILIYYFILLIACVSAAFVAPPVTPHRDLQTVPVMDRVKNILSQQKDEYYCQ